MKQLACAATAALLVFASHQAFAEIASQPENRPPFSIVPIDGKPFGQSYGEWAARWWQWALSIPAAVNPVTDTTGENCMVGQNGPVWFLAGSFVGQVERNCTLFAGRSLFFPIVNNAYLTSTDEPPENKTEEFQRAQVDCSYGVVHVTIDGVPVASPKRYLEKSAVFDVVVPADNVFGAGPDLIPGLILTPAVDQGIYLFLRPLSPGRHTIRWQATQTCPNGGGSQDITYHLIVVRPYRAP